MAIVNPSLGGAHPSGVLSPGRVKRLVDEAITRLNLDLRGLSVLTEAGSRYFSVTPLIAAVAGASRVHAIARDSIHGSADDIKRLVTGLAQMWGGLESIEFAAAPTPVILANCDIVTNLGFVRPIDSRMVNCLKPTAVVSLMCEAWEVRPADVDLQACRARGISVVATNERDSAADVFAFSGPLAAQLLFEAHIEVYRSRIVVVGNDMFAPVIATWLSAAGAEVSTSRNVRMALDKGLVSAADALVIADYVSEVPLIDSRGEVAAAEIAAARPGLAVVQIAGALAGEEIRRAGLTLVPSSPAPSRRMSRTLAALGPRPVVDLHAAGLKVGELLARARLAGLTASEAETLVCNESSIAQCVDAPGARVDS